jgi:hypothetical protein
MNEPASRRPIACGACGSERLLQPDSLETGGVTGGGVLVSVKVPVGDGRFKVRASRLAADVCVACGTVRLHVTDLQALTDAYEETKAQG